MLEDIELLDSHLLGWETSASEVIFYFEFLLAKNHPAYVESGKSEVGCFRVGRMVASEPQTISGLPQEQLPPKWSAELPEYVDVAELEDITIDPDGGLLIVAETYRVHVRAKRIDIYFD
ncbi:hypothetical protein CHH27_21015 [Labrenzia sp. VG12]|nr:hypothetical protein CHH27_21015 [Labrenzia sp. VG12]